MKTLSAILFWLIPILLTVNPAYSQSDSFSRQLVIQLNDRSKQSKLRFPRSVMRYYDQNKYQAVWINTTDQAKHTFEAMMLLDCVLQYGLAHADYHPDVLSYESLPTMLDTPEKVSVEQRVNFDITLTDAIITLINHLHYGRLNPKFSTKRIEGIKNVQGFNAVAELAKAFSKVDFTAAILTAQPKSKAYNDLQRYMRLVKGQYVGDCYQVPESEIRKVAINMERLRWWEFGGVNARQQKHVYLTCEIKDGLPRFYKDTRHLDPALEAALYHLDTQRSLKPLSLPNLNLKKD